MKKTWLAALLCMMICLSGCGSELSEEAAALQGKWAYIHDETTVILALKNSGKALYHDEEYVRYDCDGEWISLTAADGEEIKLRYFADGEDIYLYEPAVYTYTGDGTPEGIVGTWENGNWSFEFTEEGSFKEDGYFPGRYSVNEAEGSFKLMYNDPFEDTTCYYHMDGREMLVEYPWHMVKAK